MTNKIFEYQTQNQLNPKLWIDGKFNNKLRLQLLKIAQSFYKFLGVDTKVKDVTLTGSNANYNWTKHSDIDLHLIINYKDINDNDVLVRELMQAKKSLWNNTYPIKYKGMNIELYAQDENEPHASTGVYSLANNKWIQEPEPDVVSVEDDAIDKKAEPYQYEIDHLDPYEDDLLEKIKNLKARLKKLRQTGLEREGEYSIENLAFKSLRNSGHLEKLSDLEKDITLMRLTPTAENITEADPKKGTGKKPKGSSRRLYTDEDPSDTVSVKFKTRQDVVDTLNKASFKSKSHKRQSQIINLIHQRLRVAVGRTKDPAKKKRLRSAFEYIKKKKEASKKKTQRMKNEIKGFSKKGVGSRYRAIEKRGDKYYFRQDNPFRQGIKQEFGPYDTKAAALRKMNSFPPAVNYRDISDGIEEQWPSGPFGKEHDYSDYGGPFGDRKHKTDFKKGPGKTPTKSISHGRGQEEKEDEKITGYKTENFADKKVKGKSRPGRVKRAGASCKGSVTSLRKKAKKYGGEKGKMYHWCANMKSGRKKKK